MQTLIDFCRGPLFRFAAAVAVLGLARHAILSLWGMRQVLRRAGDKRLALGAVILRTVVQLNPLRYFKGNRWLYSIFSVAFHVGLILVPIFFLGHIRLWRRGLSIGWPALPTSLADVLTLVTLVAGALLFLARAWAPASRHISRPQDWLLPPLIAIEFLSGYWLAHPASNPIGLDTLTLIHVVIGDLLLLVTPFSKIAHCAMLPFSQLVAELAWRFVPGAGREVQGTLGKEGQPI